jgi:hypothetical protein
MMRPFDMTMVAFSMGAAPVPSMTRAPVKATVAPAGVWACKAGGIQGGAANALAQTARRPIDTVSSASPRRLLRDLSVLRYGPRSTVRAGT